MQKNEKAPLHILKSIIKSHFVNLGLLVGFVLCCFSPKLVA